MQEIKITTIRRKKFRRKPEKSIYNVYRIMSLVARPQTNGPKVQNYCTYIRSRNLQKKIKPLFQIIVEKIHVFNFILYIFILLYIKSYHLQPDRKINGTKMSKIYAHMSYKFTVSLFYRTDKQMDFSKYRQDSLLKTFLNILTNTV